MIRTKADRTLAVDEITIAEDIDAKVEVKKDTKLYVPVINDDPREALMRQIQ